MARSGMANLIKRVRGLADAGQDDYTVGAVTYWSDNDIQDILDSNARFLVDSPLTWREQTIGGGTVEWRISESMYRDFEEATSGTTRWAIRDSVGTQIGTANYSVDYRAGRVTFTSDQGGSAYYLTAYSFDVHAAAADIWRQRLADFVTWYQFSSNSQSFSRQQAFDHAEKMLALMERKSGSNFVPTASGDVRTSVFVRTDLC
jgi:hypothetical protein